MDEDSSIWTGFLDLILQSSVFLTRGKYLRRTSCLSHAWRQRQLNPVSECQKMQGFWSCVVIHKVVPKKPTVTLRFIVDSKQNKSTHLMKNKKVIVQFPYLLIKNRFLVHCVIMLEKQLLCYYNYNRMKQVCIFMWYPVFYSVICITWLIKGLHLYSTFLAILYTHVNSFISTVMKLSTSWAAASIIRPIGLAEARIFSRLSLS